VAEDQDPGEPASDIYVPIVQNRMDRIIIDEQERETEVVGLVVSTECRPRRFVSPLYLGSNLFHGLSDADHFLEGFDERYSPHGIKWCGCGFRKRVVRIPTRCSTRFALASLFQLTNATTFLSLLL
jgi:hypothetical protein